MRAAEDSHHQAGADCFSWAGGREDDEEVTDGSVESRFGSRNQVAALVIAALLHTVVLLVLAFIFLPGLKDFRNIIVLEPKAPEEEDIHFDKPENAPGEQPSADSNTVTVVEPNDPVPEPNSDPEPRDDTKEPWQDDEDDSSDLVLPVVGPNPGPYPHRKDHRLLAPPETEAAVDAALEWLMNHQAADGSWTFQLTCGRCGNSGDRNDLTAATALALLPFLGRGGTHEKDGPYKDTIRKGIDFLMERVDADGKVWTPQEPLWSMYSQGLACIALAECCAMAEADRGRKWKPDPKKQARKVNDDLSTLRERAEMSLKFIQEAQDQGGGGWRYQPKEAGDTSVVGWQLMALHAGRLGRLIDEEEPGMEQTFKNVGKFLDSVQTDEGAVYGYQGKGDPDHRRSAIGLLCRMYLGWKQDNPSLQDGTNRLDALGPNTDLYYGYYATQVMFQMQGPRWQAWNKKMTDLLLENQVKDGHEKGSWFNGVDGCGLHGSGGRLYCTTLAAMILEVYYRHLRIYRVYDEFPE